MAQKLQTQKASSPKAVAGTELDKAVSVRVDDLHLDPKNPRLLDSNFGLNDQDDILERLWTDFHVSEIADSIFASECFWQHEPLIASRENGKLVVIEASVIHTITAKASMASIIWPDRGRPVLAGKNAIAMSARAAMTKPRRFTRSAFGSGA